MGWAANILFVLGVVALGNKRRFGFVLNTIANGLYTLVGVNHGMYDLAAISVIMCGLNVYSYRQWGSECTG